MSAESIVATYHIETPYSLEEAAECLAGEQSTGTFVKVPGETEDLREQFRARVVNIVPFKDVDEPSLEGSRPPSDLTPPIRYKRGKVTVSFPLDTVGVQLTSVISTVAGNLFELREFSGIRLVDLEFPPVFAGKYAGPQFGIDGTRELTGVFDRPIIGTIIKPSVGLSPEQTAGLVSKLAAADVDFIKDDELMGNPPHSPLEERVKAVMEVINDHADRTGKKIMYAFNISDDVDAMLGHHDLVLESGGTSIMVSLNSVGFSGVSHLARYSRLPIHGHRNGWAMWTRYPQLGMSFQAYQKLWRLAGVDHIHVNALQNKFWEPDDSVVQSIRACLTPMFDHSRIMPVLSSGQWGGQAPDTYRLAGSVDLMYLAGGGIVAHPGGPGAGVTAIRQAWAAAVDGIPLSDYAKDHVELKQSLEKFG